MFDMSKLGDMAKMANQAKKIQQEQKKMQDDQIRVLQEISAKLDKLIEVSSQNR